MNITGAIDSILNSSRTAEIFRGLENAGYKYSSLMYPDDLGSRNSGLGHYMIFNINETEGLKSPSDIPKKIQNSSLGGIINKIGKIENLLAPAINSSISSNAVKDRLGSKGNTKRISQTIMLYMPDNITSELSTNWENTELNNVWAIETLRAINWATAQSSETLETLSKSVLTDLSNKFTTAQFKEMISSGAYSGILGDDNRLVWEAKNRKLKNPHMEFLFKSVNPRTFTYDFKFTPKSAAEAENVRKIIETFRKHAAPSVESTTAFGVYWRYPSTFDIAFISNGNENKFLHRVSTCALSNISINYTASGQWAGLRDASGNGSPPVYATMSLTFQELELISRERIEQGY